jgi:hypothetical protein
MRKINHLLVADCKIMPLLRFPAVNVMLPSQAVTAAGRELE